MDLSFAQEASQYITKSWGAAKHIFSGGFIAGSVGSVVATATFYYSYRFSEPLTNYLVGKIREKSVYNCEHEFLVGLSRVVAVGALSAGAGCGTAHILASNDEKAPAPIVENVEAPAPNPAFRQVNWQETIQHNAAQESGLKR